MKPSRNTVLLIAFFYPPSRSSGVHRALAMGNFLAAQGHDVVVVTAAESFFELESGPPDYSQMPLIDDRITVVRVPFSSRPIHQSLDLLSPTMVRLKPLLDRVLPASLRRIASKGLLRSGGSFFPAGLEERYRTWYGVVIDSVLGSIDAGSLKAIIATGNPFTSFAVARTLSELSGAPYVIDYRDPWKIDVRTSLPQLRSSDTEELERSLIADAAAVTLPNDHLADEYRRYFSESAAKIRVIENGYDDAALPPIRSASAAVDATDGLRFGSLGTVSDMWPLAEFGAAWRRYRTERTEASFELAGHLGWFNSGHDDLRRVIDDLGAGTSYSGPVQRADVADFYDRLDVVVLFLWGDRGLTAGKMYEVAALGRPIVCIQPEGGGVRAFLEREHPDAICVGPDADQIIDALCQVERLVEASTPDRQRSLRAHFQPYERHQLLRPLEEIVAGVERRP